MSPLMSTNISKSKRKASRAVEAAFADADLTPREVWELVVLAIVELGKRIPLDS
jgi:hypothetical protein